MFLNDSPTPEIYPLSLHDALPIFPPHAAVNESVQLVRGARLERAVAFANAVLRRLADGIAGLDRKSTRLNSSHANISYAVFCLNKTEYLLLPGPSSPQRQTLWI